LRRPHHPQRQRLGIRGGGHPLPLLHRCGGQVRPAGPPRLAARRHGGPHPRLRPPPLGHHGHRRRVPPPPPCSPHSPLLHHTPLHRCGWGSHSAGRCRHSPLPEGHQEDNRLLHL